MVSHSCPASGLLWSGGILDVDAIANVRNKHSQIWREAVLQVFGHQGLTAPQCDKQSSM
jgi:hypothetical protein